MRPTTALVRSTLRQGLAAETMIPHLKRWARQGLRCLSSPVRPSPWLPETKDEPPIPRSDKERHEQLQPLAEFWNTGVDTILQPPISHAPWLSHEQLVSILDLPLPGDAPFDTNAQPILQALYTAANLTTEKYHGDKVHYRGLLEFSNICRCDCHYCGIRKSRHQPRFTLSDESIMEAARWSAQKGYGSMMLQSGEVGTPQRLERLCRIIRQIVDETGMGISLSVGELPDEYYKKLREAGAKRYLLRIETSNPTLFASLHPPTQTFARRLDRLRALRRAGFMVGTGVMINLPGQTTTDLANDLLFFKQEDVDMIGMGPYIWQRETPTGDLWESMYPELVHAYKRRDDQAATEDELLLLDRCGAKQFEMTTRMVALARLLLQDVNLAATTALQTVHPTGREVALMRGANILMPILTPKEHRAHYQLYEGKVCVDESAKQCRSCLELRVAAAGKRIAYNDHGDPPHYAHRMQGVS